MSHEFADPINRQIAEGLKAGLNYRQIAEPLGISRPAVSQRVHRNAELRRLRRRRRRRGMDALSTYRQELLEIQTDLRGLAVQVKRALKELDEEIEAEQIDRLLGV